jgi:hypothetical protein
MPMILPHFTMQLLANIDRVDRVYKVCVKFILDFSIIDGKNHRYPFICQKQPFGKSSDRYDKIPDRVVRLIFHADKIKPCTSNSMRKAQND